MSYFSTEQPSGFKFKTIQERSCHYCGAPPNLIRKMLDPRSGRTVRMFECQCGDRTWNEDKE